VTSGQRCDLAHAEPPGLGLEVVDAEEHVGAGPIDGRTCESGEVAGVLCHVFIPFGGWGGGSPRNGNQRILDYTNAQLHVDAAITWNLGLSAAGVVAADNLAVFDAIRERLEARP
jgi:hypothetical protein